MPEILMTPEGKKVKISKKDDVCLFDAPHNPPNTGTAYTAGTDLYAHKARSGNWYYYEYHWSMWQGTEERHELITEEEAKRFILERATMSGHMALGASEKQKAEELWGKDFFDEDA